CLQNLVGDVNTRTYSNRILDDEVVTLAFGDSLDGLVSLLNDVGKLFIATPVEVFLKLATLALKVRVKVGKFTLALDALGFGEDRSILVESLNLIAQGIGQTL